MIFSILKKKFFLNDGFKDSSAVRITCCTLFLYIRFYAMRIDIVIIIIVKAAL